MEKCPKCFSEQRVRGDVVAGQNPHAGIRFHPDDLAKISHRTKLQAVACPFCGYVEFFLVPENESADPPGLGTWVFA